MSVLDEVLREEYDRLLRMRTAMELEYESLPKGSLCKKNIRGYECYYLQHREGEKIISKYIGADNVIEYSQKIEKRRNLKKQLSAIKEEMKKIERTLK